MFSKKKKPPSGQAGGQVFFNYNDHSWEAHEVLGVTIGAELVIITRSYQEALRGASLGSHEFLETAYLAILRRRKEVY